MKRAILLGASGFIGRRLLNRLMADDWAISVVVRARASVLGIEEREGLRCVEIDGSPASVARAVESAECPIVFNLAAAGVGGASSYRDLIAGNEGVVAGILDGAINGGVHRVVHTGSWSQYQVNSNEPLTENSRMEPQTVYGVAKLAAESLGRLAAPSLDLTFTSLRLFNVYGPGESNHRLIPHVASSILKGERPQLTSGLQSRDFVYVDDAVEAIARVAALRESRTEALNVCTGVPTRVKDVASLAAQAAGGDTSMVDFGTMPQRPGEATSVVGDPTALASAIGWQPTTTIHDGIRRTVDWVAKEPRRE